MQKMSLIVSIVRKGWGSTVLEAAMAAGARGSTVVTGRGAGINEQEKIFGISIEPEKEIMLTVVYDHQVEAVMEAVVEAGHLNDTGRGIAFVLPVSQVSGIAHFMKAPPAEG
jgi:nitrogen regulatory protein PII